MSAIVRNSFALLTARMVPLFLSLVKVAILSRVLGVDLFGSYCLIVAWALVGELAIFSGVRTVIPRETARQPDRAAAYLAAGWIAAGLFGGLGVVVGWIAAGWVYGESHLAMALRLVSLSFAPSAFIAGGEAVFVGLERMGIVARDAIADAFTASLASIAVVLAGGGLLPLAGAIVLGRVVALGSLSLALHARRLGPQRALEAAELRRIVLASASYSAIALLALSHFKVDLFLLSKLRGDYEVGLYGAAYRFLELALIYPAVVVAAVYPRLAAISRSARKEFGQTAGGAVLALWVPLLPLAALTAWLAGGLITLLFGAEYRPGAAALQILIWASIPFALDQVLAYGLIARGRHFFGYWVNGLGLVLNVALNLWLIPRLGFFGCAVATVVSLSFVALLVVAVSVKDRLPVRLPDLNRTVLSVRRAVYD